MVFNWLKFFKLTNNKFKSQERGNIIEIQKI